MIRTGMSLWATQPPSARPAASRRHLGQNQSIYIYKLLRRRPRPLVAALLDAKIVCGNMAKDGGQIQCEEELRALYARWEQVAKRVPGWPPVAAVRADAKIVSSIMAKDGGQV